MRITNYDGEILISNILSQTSCKIPWCNCFRKNFNNILCHSTTFRSRMQGGGKGLKPRLPLGSQHGRVAV